MPRIKLLTGPWCALWGLCKVLPKGKTALSIGGSKLLWSAGISRVGKLFKLLQPLNEATKYGSNHLAAH